MTGALFCPSCGVRLSVPGQRFCLVCGAAIPELAVAPAGGSIPGDDEGTVERARRQGAPDPREPDQRSSPGAGIEPVGAGRPATPWTRRATRSLVALPEDALAVLAPAAAWLAFSVLSAILFADIFTTAVGGWVGSLPVVSTALGAIGSATYGMLASLYAGLGYRLAADVSASGLGINATGSAQLVAAAPAMGSLLLLWLVTWVCVRRAARRVGHVPASVAILRAATIATLTAVVVLVAAAQLGSRFGGSFRGSPSLGFGPFSVGGDVTGSLIGGPVAGDVLLLAVAVLFTAAIVGTVGTTGWPGIIGWRASAAVSRFRPMITAGILGPLLGLALLTLPYIAAAAIWWLVTAPADNGAGARLLPLLTAYAPNWVAEMAVLSTGTIIHSDSGGPGGAIVLSIWSSPPWLVALGCAALLLPGYLAGAILQGLDPRPSAGRILAVAALVSGIVVVLARFGLPSASITQSGIAEGLTRDVHFTFDALEALSIGIVVSVLAVLAGSRGGSRVWRVVIRLVPGLHPKGRPTMQFR